MVGIKRCELEAALVFYLDVCRREEGMAKASELSTERQAVTQHWFQSPGWCPCSPALLPSALLRRHAMPGRGDVFPTVSGLDASAVLCGRRRFSEETIATVEQHYIKCRLSRCSSAPRYYESQSSSKKLATVLGFTRNLLTECCEGVRAD